MRRTVERDLIRGFDRVGYFVENVLIIVSLGNRLAGMDFARANG